MIKVIVKNKPFSDHELDDTECENYWVNAVYSLPKEATSTDAAKMFYKALEAEGYFPYSIAKAFKEMSEYIADYYNFDLEEKLEIEDEF